MRFTNIMKGVVREKFCKITQVPRKEKVENRDVNKAEMYKHANVTLPDLQALIDHEKPIDISPTKLQLGRKQTKKGTKIDKPENEEVFKYGTKPTWFFATAYLTSIAEKEALDNKENQPPTKRYTEGGVNRVKMADSLKRSCCCTTTYPATIHEDKTLEGTVALGDPFPKNCFKGSAGITNVPEGKLRNKAVVGRKFGKVMEGDTARNIWFPRLPMVMEVEEVAC